MTPLLCILYTCVGMSGAWLVAVHWLGVDPGTFISKTRVRRRTERLFDGLDQGGRVRLPDLGHLLHARLPRGGRRAGRGAVYDGSVFVHSSVSILIANYVLTSLLLGNPAG